MIVNAPFKLTLAQIHNCSQVSFIASLEGHPPPQLSVKLFFRTSSELVVASTTVLHLQQKWGLGKRSGFAIDESRTMQ